MNPITKALDEIMFRIPRAVLEKVFVQRFKSYRDVPKDIKERIRFEVIEQRVLVDTDLVGGNEVRIPLDSCPKETSDDGYTNIYRIPKKLTDGRRITSVLDVTYGNIYPNTPGYGMHAYSRSGQALQVASTVMEANLRSPYTGSARARPLGENVVMVQDSQVIPQNMWIRVLLGHDENLSTIKARSYPIFSKLVELAVKSFIYNEYVVDLDVGELRGGQQVGKIKEIIDGYADAETSYQEYLTEKWAKVVFMNDDESNQRFTNLLIGGIR